MLHDVIKAECIQCMREQSESEMCGGRRLRQQQILMLVARMMTMTTMMMMLMRKMMNGFTHVWSS